MSISEDKKANSEENHFEEIDSIARPYLKKAYLPLKVIGVMLIDFVPYEKKEQMLEGLRKLFLPEGNAQPDFIDKPNLKEIPDIRNSGILTGGGNAKVGIIFNSDLGSGLRSGVQKKIPAEFSSIEISVGQFVDYTYHIVYSCKIKEEYQNRNLEQIFVESEDGIPYTEIENGTEIYGSRPRGPELEPTLREYQTEIQEFLKPFSSGLFLKENSSQVFCPSLKVYSLPHIDFSSFEIWSREHSRLLNFLGFELYYCRFDNMIVSDYSKSLLENRPQSIFQGLVFVASEDKYQDKSYRNPQTQIMSKLAHLGWEGLFSLLTICYWSVYNIEITQSECQLKTAELLKTIQALKSQTKLSSLIIYQVYDDVLESYNNFNNYKLTEIGNIRVAKENSVLFRLNRIGNYSKVLSKPEINVFQNLYDGNNRFLELEQKRLEKIQQEFDSLFQYCTNLVNMNLSRTNLNLQRSMNLMTIVMLILTIAAVALALSSFYSQIWNFLRTLELFTSSSFGSRLIGLT